jgi:hypothetical protein
MGIGLGAVGEGVLKVIENAVLTAHVMGRLGFMAKRWAAQHQFVAGVLDQVREVGCATGELADAGLTAKPRDVGLQVRVNLAGVEFFARADTGRRVGERHGYLFCLFLRPDNIR